MMSAQNVRIYLVKRRQRGREGGHKIGKMSRRRLWMAPNTYSLLKDLPPFFVEAPNAQWVDILSEVELIFSCVIVICFLIIHSGQVPKLNEDIVKKIKNNQVFDCTVLSVGTDIIYAGSTYLLSKLIR